MESADSEFTDVTDFKNVLEKVLPRLSPEDQTNLLQTQFMKYCRLGYKPFVEHLIPQCEAHRSIGLITACEYGRIDIVNLLYNDTISQSTRDNCLRVACRKGQIDVVNLLIKHGANDWAIGLENACESGNMPLIQMMIDKGSDSDIWEQGIWDSAFYSACFANHMDVADLMIAHGARDFNGTMVDASHYGRLDIVKYCASKGATSFSNSIHEAIECGHEDVVTYLGELLNQRDAINVSRMCKKDSLKHVAQLLGV